jgi:hypothetical protein
MGFHSKYSSYFRAKDVFATIGNGVGSYYELNYTFHETRYDKKVRILVGLEKKKGLP